MGWIKFSIFCSTWYCLMCLFFYQELAHLLAPDLKMNPCWVFLDTICSYLYILLLGLLYVRFTEIHRYLRSHYYSISCQVMGMLPRVNFNNKCQKFPTATKNWAYGSVSHLVSSSIWDVSYSYLNCLKSNSCLKIDEADLVTRFPK